MYDSPDSFIKTFTRFHGLMLLAVRKDNVTMKKFVQLRISIYLKGWYTLEFVIKKIESFNFVG